MRHVFRATKIGWNKEQEGIYFDSADYSAEEAKAQFRPYRGTTKNGYPYTGYEHDGQRYHDVTYLGEFENNKMPHNDRDYIKSLLNRNRKSRKNH